MCFSCPSSQLAGVVVLEGPPLGLDGRITVLHDQLVLRLVDRQTPVGRAVTEQVRLVRVVPVLIAPGTVARVQHHVIARVVKARLIPPDLTRFAQHPVLKWVGRGNLRVYGGKGAG